MPHSNSDQINTGSAPVWAGYCRGCGAWYVSIAGAVKQVGAGIDTYHDAIDDLAPENPDCDAAFFYDLGGHAAEVMA